ncbi:hypothetical protein ACCO45_005490 [Purpureocillium lilacinum]|uniref:Uncharacterized protein n=1 Tax=Purpureocillium lilacinum TaxID=33203 RepID=A0ACC4DW94_PURLI
MMILGPGPGFWLAQPSSPAAQEPQHTRGVPVGMLPCLVHLQPRIHCTGRSRVEERHTGKMGTHTSRPCPECLIQEQQVRCRECLSSPLSLVAPLSSTPVRSARPSNRRTRRSKFARSGQETANGPASAPRHLVTPTPVVVLVDLLRRIGVGVRFVQCKQL